MKSLNSDKARRARVRTVVGVSSRHGRPRCLDRPRVDPVRPPRSWRWSPRRLRPRRRPPAPPRRPPRRPTPSDPCPALPVDPTVDPQPGCASHHGPSPPDPWCSPVDHHVLARIEGSELQANYLPVDEPVPDAAQFQTFRVRFQVHNAGTTPITTTPRLEYRTDAGGASPSCPKQPMGASPSTAPRMDPQPGPGRWHDARSAR